MWSDFILLFSEMNTLAAICLTAGMILIFVELFIPGFGIFGGLGGVLLIVGIISRIANHGDANPLNLFFILSAMLLVILSIAFYIMSRSVKKGKLSRSPIVEHGTAISMDRSDGTANFSGIVGCMGIAMTSLRPSGIVVIEDKEYDVVASGFFIDKGEMVKVVATEGIKIIVKKVSEPPIKEKAEIQEENKE